MDSNIFFFIAYGIFGAVTTFLLQRYGCSVVVASCIVGLIGALIGHFTGSTDLPLIIFAGSFVGMTSVSFGSIPLMVVAGGLSGIVYQLSQNVFAGYGGRLGTIAFVSTVAITYIFKLINFKS